MKTGGVLCAALVMCGWRGAAEADPGAASDPALRAADAVKERTTPWFGRLRGVGVSGEGNGIVVFEGGRKDGLSIGGTMVLCDARQHPVPGGELRPIRIDKVVSLGKSTLSDREIDAFAGVCWYPPKRKAPER
jgi:hypothetical protein